MDVNAFLDGFSLVTQPETLLFCFLGVVIGMLIGVLPGLGPAATIAILLPITYTVDPVSAIIMLAGIYYGAQYGGTITSVLLRLPGEASVGGHRLRRLRPGQAGQGRHGPRGRGHRVVRRRHGVDHRPHLPRAAHRRCGRRLPGPRVRRARAARRAAGRHHRQRQRDQGARRRLGGAAAGHRRARQVHRRRPVHLRQPAARRRPRLRRRRDGPLRRRRDPLQPRAAPREAARTCRGRQHLALARRAEAVLRRDRPRLGRSASASACCPAAVR